MTRIVAGTDSAETSEKLCDYLESRLTEADEVHVLNSLHGGNDEEMVEQGREALSMFEDLLGETFDVETEQNTNASDPAHDLLTAADEYDADEIVLGLTQKRSPAQKVLFGSNTQSVLMQTRHPVVGVPLRKSR
ncbi:stress response protein [Haladaptatus sp. W1]|uniref:universal stress protein n=1 Tax=Haladaptatus sp. W1 TaxID=1897478 RepID=UPI0008498F3D|nr:universal stress protein [Haladaptatus sp. W1]ODR80300.1 stress response protein [Haladaptatus sp. W1]